MISVEFAPVRARAPLRLGLAGGGTDLSPFCDTHGGGVLNCTIDRYAFAYVSPRPDGQLCFRAKDLGQEETFSDPADAAASRLSLHRGVYFRMMRDFNEGRLVPMTISTSVDAPMGSGLGTSSAIVVALVESFRLLMDLPLGPYDVARLAFEIERVDLALSGGRQDQYAAAFGGPNFIEFLADDRTIVNPLRIRRSVLKELESSMVIAFSGQSRSSAEIIDQQTSAMVANDKAAIDALLKLKQDAIDMKDLLLRGDISGMAAIFRQSWAAKKATARSVSNPRIESLFDLALANGATAGKVSGAGGGGFLMFLVDPEDRHDLIEILEAHGANADPVIFTHTGCEAWQPRR